MRHLIQAIPFHSDEVEVLENLSRIAATTEIPITEPEIPSELKKLFEEYGLLDKDGKPIELSPLSPVLSDSNSDGPSSIAVLDDEEDDMLSLEELQKKIRKASLVNAKDYESFKQIEGGKKNVTSDMESFFKQFGIVDTGDLKKKKPTRSTKAPSIFTVPSIDSSYLIPGYSSLLDNIGIRTIKDKTGQKNNSKALWNASKFEGENKTGADDYEKLEILLDTIKELENLNASLTEKEIDRLNLKNFNFSESLLSEGPDPVMYQQYYSSLKNEVKRQQPTDEPTKLSLGGLDLPLLESSLESTDDGKDVTTPLNTATESTTKEVTTLATTTKASIPSEQEKKNSLEDEIEPIEDPETLPPPRRSGFYMLFDWNSFLEVGEDPDKVVIRFDPKIGDPSRFLSVNVP